SWDTYLDMVDSLFANIAVDRDLLHEQAKQFAMRRASHSGRTAIQFYRQFVSKT
ncbi:ATPase, partial [Pseudidiomarina aestuarii]